MLEEVKKGVRRRASPHKSRPPPKGPAAAPIFGRNFFPVASIYVLVIFVLICLILSTRYIRYFAEHFEQFFFLDFHPHPPPNSVRIGYN